MRSVTHVYLVGNMKRKQKLIPLWYDCNQLPHSMSKCCRPSAHKRAQTQKTVVIDNGSPKRLSAAVAKLNMELRDTDSDNENETDLSYGLSNFGNESDISDTNSRISSS